MNLLETLQASGLILASGNSGKLKELHQLLEPLQIAVRSIKQSGQSFDVAETEPDFKGNAALKARAAYGLSGLICLADDSGLCVDALDGAPGVRSARYGSPDLDDAGRCEFLLKKMQAVPDANRGASFQCVLALCSGPGAEDIFYFTGTCKGQIARQKSGENGFGYDPIFLDAASGRAFATLSPQKKNARSHRGRALQKLLDFLRRVPL